MGKFCPPTSEAIHSPTPLALAEMGGETPFLWRLEMLGGFRAQRLSPRVADDENPAPILAPVEHFRPKPASLLAFLAFHRGAHRREVLCELFWPGADIEDARNSLRVALSALRKLLEPQGVPESGPEGAVLLNTRDAVALGHAVETDIALFQRALQSAKQLENGAQPSPLTLETALVEAITLYRGPLLRGLSCEWMTGEEGRFEEQYIAAFTALLDHLEGRGETARALDLARAAIAAAPAREEPIRAALRLGLQSGQIAQSAREWELWQKRAVRDGISVDGETLQLAQAVQNAPVSNLAAASDHNSVADSRDVAAAVSKIVAQTNAEPRGRSLPAQWTTFFGRAADIATLQGWLEQPASQLVTITGPGGGGKTRLALEVARHFASETDLPIFSWVEWLPVANLPYALFLTGAILDVIGAPRGDGSPATLVAALQHKVAQHRASGIAAPRLLLILDNFEHLCVEGAPMVRELLEAVPELVFLVASRSPLSFSGEREWPLQPLETPSFELFSGAPDAAYSSVLDATTRDGSSNDLARFRALSASASVQLFLDRARLARPSFRLDSSNIEVVARLCAYLDGLPLALELAAARIALFSPAQILRGVNGQEQHAPPSLNLASRLTSTLDLARDSTFTSPFTSNSEAVPTSTLTAAAKPPAPLDWVNLDRTAPARHHSLRATIAWSEQQLPHQAAQFWSRLSVFRGGWTLEAAAFVCQERDAAPLVLALRDVSLILLDTRHETPRGRLLEVLREYAAEGLSADGQHEVAGRHARYFLHWAETVKPHLDGPRVAHYLRRLETERDNLRAAYIWHLQNDVEAALRLGVALYWSWELRGRVEEGRDALARTLEAAREAFPDLEGQAATDEVARRRLHLVASALIGAGKLATVASDNAAARQHLEAALRLFRALGDDLSTADCLYSLGYMNLKSGDLAEARILCDESVAIYRQFDNNAALCDALYNRALVALYEGDFAMVRALNNERLSMHRAAGERRGVAISLESLGFAALFNGETEAARTYFSESLLIFEAISEYHSITRALWGLGHTARAAGQSDAARDAFRRALRLARDTQTLWTLPYILEGLVHLLADALHEESALKSGDAGTAIAARAARLLGAAALLRETHDEPLPDLVFSAQHEAALHAVRAKLGEAHFESEWQLGRTLAPDAIIAFALDG